MILLFIGILLIACLIFIILIATKKITFKNIFGENPKNPKNPENPENPKNPENPNYKNVNQYINPQDFKTGYILNSPQKIADSCRTSSNLYPIQPVYVQYGPGPDCKDCDVLKFNSVP